jgi:glutathionyl-hydroquinone reductase
VNNESSEIIRIFNSAFNDILPEGEGKKLDLYPEPLRAEIDDLNAWVYETINSMRCFDYDGRS